MTPLDIKIALIRAGVSQARIADVCNVSKTQVNRVIHDPNSVSNHVRCEIARCIGKTVEQVWPDYYADPPKVGRPSTRTSAGCNQPRRIAGGRC